MKAFRGKLWLQSQAKMQGCNKENKELEAIFSTYYLWKATPTLIEASAKNEVLLCQS